MIETKHLAFIHIPKTGGTFVRKALKDCGLITYHPADVHEMRPTKKTKFAFVRHPIEWLISYYHHQRYTHLWETHRELDGTCKANTINDFLRNVAKRPGVAQRTIDRWLRNADLIGRCETVSNDLQRILNWAGEEYDTDIIDRLPPTNVQERTESPDEELLDKIYETEFALFINYGYSRRRPNRRRQLLQ